MTNHPRRSRSRLAQYGATLRTIEGQRVVEMVNPNDNSRARYQYQRYDGALGPEILRRMLAADGTVLTDWTALTHDELAALMHTRGEYHPILDPLGF